MPLKWKTEIRNAAFKLLKELTWGATDEEDDFAKDLLDEIQNRQFTVQLAMMVHTLNVWIADHYKKKDD